MKISEAIVKKAAKAATAVYKGYELSPLKARAALTSVIPDIEKEIREECAGVADKYEQQYEPGALEEGIKSTEFGRCSAAAEIACAIRSLPSSTQQEG